MSKRPLEPKGEALDEGNKESVEGLSSQDDEPPPAKKAKKKVAFKDVTVYYFPRAQGFICVPSQGGSSLGMDVQHTETESFSVQEHLEEKKKYHRELLRNHKKLTNSQCSETEESGEDLSDLSEYENDEECSFLRPLPTHQRRALLRQSGVRKIDSWEKEECRHIRMSRENCGCHCKFFCLPDHCSCSREGIKCQVDRMSFPCGCTAEGCRNLAGRIEFNPFRVRSHFIHTLLRVKREEQEIPHPSESDSLAKLFMPSSSKNETMDFHPNRFLTQALRKGDSNDTADIIDKKKAVLLKISEKKLANNLLLYSSPFSPEESSYSESSDYSSDELCDIPSQESEVNGSSTKDSPCQEPASLPLMKDTPSTSKVDCINEVALVLADLINHSIEKESLNS